MPKYTTTKLVEAVMLNRKTGAPTSKRIDLPYGAIIQDPREERGTLQFLYLGELYAVKLADIQGYYEPIGERAGDSGSTDSTAKPAAAAKPEKSLEFEKLRSNLAVKRAKAPGGWIVVVGDGVTFVPDPSHKWDGSSV